MKKLLLVVATLMLSLGSIAGYAEEVKLTDQDRTDLRQRVDTLRTENAFGRTRDQGAQRSVMGSHDTTRVKAKRSKTHTKKHMRRGSAKGNRS